MTDTKRNAELDLQNIRDLRISNHSNQAWAHANCIDSLEHYINRAAEAEREVEELKAKLEQQTFLMARTQMNEVVTP